VSLVNLIAGREIVPELLQEKATPDNISRALFELLDDNEARARMKKGLAEVVGRLGEPGASRRAAELALSVAVWS
jgi:lipid-A-disaccharide synthase